MERTTRTPPRITPLKRVLFERQITVTALAESTGLNRGRLSDIVNGRGLPDDRERNVILQGLRGVEPSDLWPDQDRAA